MDELQSVASLGLQNMDELELVASLERCSLTENIVQVGVEDIASKHAQRHGMAFDIEHRPRLSIYETVEAFERRDRMWLTNVNALVAQLRRALCELRKAILSYDVSVTEHEGRVMVHVTCWMIPLKPEFLAQYEGKGDTLFTFSCTRRFVWEEMVNEK